jgi:hypothetical protein
LAHNLLNLLDKLSWPKSYPCNYSSWLISQNGPYAERWILERRLS